MATLVGGYCLPHDPLITGAPKAASAEVSDKVLSAFAYIRDEIDRLAVDTVVIIGDDHCAMFSPACQPSMLIGIGDLEGPLEPESWLGIARRRVLNNSPLAQHIVEEGLDQGFDWSVSKSLVLDHSVMVPLHLSVPAHVRSIPVYIAAGMLPLIRTKRCYQLGRMIRSAIESWPGEERVAILGTGGLSHWVGMADSGKVNQDFDRKVLGLIEQGDIAALVAMSDDDVMGGAGNGALEIRNWIVALSAMSPSTQRVIAYEPVEPWISGLGFVELAHA